MRFRTDCPVHIVMLGCGGTGGHIAPHLYRLLHALFRPSKVILCDGDIVESKIRLPSSCSMPLCKGSKPAQYSIREIFFIRLVSSCAILFASKVVEKL